MSETLPTPLSIAIVGAGIGGPALSLALSPLSNVKCTIYESRPELGGVGAGLALGPNAHSVVKLMSSPLWESYRSRASFKSYKPTSGCSTHDQWEETEGLWADVTVGEGDHAGKRVIAVSLKSSMSLSTAHRADFVAELAKLLPNESVEFNKTLVNVSQKGEKMVCAFSDGSVVEADAVIGCDGIRSVCRKFVFEDKDQKYVNPVFSQMAAYRGLVPMKEAVKVMGKERAHNRNIMLGHGKHVITFPVSDGTLVNVCAMRNKEEWKGPWVEKGQKENITREFEGWDESVTKILELVKDPDLWAMFDHLPVSTFHKGGICLLGDAAQSTTPHIAQGASMALEDAYILSNLLALCERRQDILAAFDAYDFVRVPRRLQVTATSRQQGIIMNMEDEVLGDDLTKIAEALDSRMRWIWELDSAAHLAAAVERFYQAQNA